MAEEQSVEEPSQGGKLVDEGIRHYEAGQVGRAIECFTQAQRLYQRTNEVQGIADCLGNLANCYYRLGQIQQAIDYGEDALTLRRGIGDWPGVGLNLSNLGCCYMVLGQTAKAAQLFEQALGLAGEWEDQRGRARRLNNLGNVYGALGQTQRAIECYEQALGLQRALSDRPGESVHLTNLAGVLVDDGRCAEAIVPAQASVEICEAYHLPASYSNIALALAHLGTGNLERARLAAEGRAQLRRTDEQPYGPDGAGPGGAAAGRPGGGAEACTAAIAHANVLLERDAQNVDALDAKMLALCALAICRGGQPSGSTEAAEALAAYRAARALNQDAGVVSRLLQLWAY